MVLGMDMAEFEQPIVPMPILRERFEQKLIDDPKMALEISSTYWHDNATRLPRELTDTDKLISECLKAWMLGVDRVALANILLPPEALTFWKVI